MRPIPLFKHASSCSVRGECDCYLEFDDDILPPTEELYCINEIPGSEEFFCDVEGWKADDVMEIVHQIYGVYKAEIPSENIKIKHLERKTRGLFRGLAIDLFASWVALPPAWSSGIQGCHREAAWTLEFSAVSVDSGGGYELKGFELLGLRPSYARPEGVNS